jgi:hypothetical protein
VRRNAVRRLVLGLAIASFAGALLVLGIAFWALANLGGGHVGTASLFATAVFLGCCAVVLYFMSLGRRPVEPE